MIIAKSYNSRCKFYVDIFFVLFCFAVVPLVPRTLHDM